MLRQPHPTNQPLQPQASVARAAAGVLLAGALCVAPSVKASTVVAWDFENASLGATLIAASTAAGGVSGATFNTGNNGVENCCGANGQLSMTRFFGVQVFPSLTFTLASAVNGDFSFNHYHNHNPGFPTTPSYEFDVQISQDGGATWSDIASNLVASAATNTQAVTITGLSLQSGTYSVRWVGNNFTFGTDSNTEYFGLDNVTLASVPTPGSTLLVALGLLALGLTRKRTS